MTETTNICNEPAGAVPSLPADILMNLIVTTLVPMLLGASGGDINLARSAATDAVNAYRASDHADLIAVSQIVAFGLAALNSLSLSMVDGLPLSSVLRLRGNAAALSRSAKQNRRAVAQPHNAHATVNRNEVSGTPGAKTLDSLVKTTVVAIETHGPVAETPALQHQHGPANPPANTRPLRTATPAASVAAVPNQQWDAMLVSAMTQVAEEFTGSLLHLPPAGRRQASMRATALSSAANILTSGTLPARLRPGALAPMISANRI